MNKKAFELTINFTVILILSMFIFSIGIIIAMDIFEFSEETRKQWEQRMKEDMQHEMAENGLAISSENLKEGENTVFLLGITNRHENAVFYVKTECDLVVADAIICDDDDGIPCDIYDRMLVDPGPVSIPAGGSEFVDILAYVSGQEKGTYVFDLQVCLDSSCNEEYTSPKKLSIIVN